MCKVEEFFTEHKIDRWLEFAVARQVQRLELDLLDGGDLLQYIGSCYNFPVQHFGLNDYDYSAQPRLNKLPPLLHNFFKSLKLPQYIGSCYNFPVQHFGLNDYDYSAQPRLNKLPPLLHNFFKSLKVLLFKSVNLTGEVVEFFIYNCPSLEELTVHASETLVNLQVVGPSVKLKYLSIWYCIALKSLKICDTNLVTLSTTLSAARLLLVNVPMLIESHALGFPTNILDAMLPCISSCVLSQLEVLKINSDIIILSKHSEYGLVYLGKYKIPQLTMLKKFVLVLEAWEDRTFLDCTKIIEAAPQLTEFELNLFGMLAGFPPEWNPDSGISFVLLLLLSLIWIKPKRSKRECRKVASCPLHHLKVLKLYGYCTSELELVRYFLENAIVLEKILVDPLPLENFRIEGEPRESKPVRIARKYAKLQLEREVPSHIELVIL
ncbi:hypothetical protein MTR67_018624 [Solanum verrucosum]|uniref:FBD domain-containing protein n=1 Tax=Solanum verrucosum TaxID=315347 RepID=A0AAF0TMV2_SOLVR|nr:hypothetical protein MTR67_018624 [Solanum verrucosum]